MPLGLSAQREKLIFQLEEERRLRLESEKRLREVTEEAELGRAQAASLQQQFSRYDPTRDPSGDQSQLLLHPSYQPFYFSSSSSSSSASAAPSYYCVWSWKLLQGVV